MADLLPMAAGCTRLPAWGRREWAWPSRRRRVAPRDRVRLLAIGAGGGDTVIMRLLEREESLGSLATYAREARRGDGRLVLVAGEAGVGKSALVERFQSELPGARWSWGACDGLFTPRPLGPLFDLAAQLGGDGRELCALRRCRREELFGALLRQVSGPGPLDVVVVEDVHWADEATVDLLRFPGRRLRGAPRCSSSRTATRTWPRMIRCGSRWASSPGSAPPGGSARALSAGAVHGLARERAGGRRAVPADGRKPVLRHRGLAGRDGGGAGVGPGRRAGAGGRPECRRPAAARGRRADRRPRGSGGCSRRTAGCPPTAVDELAGVRAARRRRRAAAVPARDRPAGGRAGHPRAPPRARSTARSSTALEARRVAGRGADGFSRRGGRRRCGGAAIRASAAAHRAAALASHREAVAQFERALRFAAGQVPADGRGRYDELATEADPARPVEQAAEA